MEDNRTSIKKRLDDIFIEKMGYLVNRLTNDQRSKSLLSDSAGMQARDLLKLYMELENEFHIDFNPLVLDGKEMLRMQLVRLWHLERGINEAI